MKTYHTYFGDSQQAETKLKRAESQRVKSDQATHTVIGRPFRRDYNKLSEKVLNFKFLLILKCDLMLLLLLFVVLILLLL